MHNQSFDVNPTIKNFIESGSNDKLASFSVKDRQSNSKGSSGLSDINSQVVIGNSQDQISRVQVTPKSKLGLLQRKSSDLCGDDIQRRNQIKEISSRFSRNDLRSQAPQGSSASSFLNASREASPFSSEMNLAERRKIEKDLPRPTPRTAPSNPTRPTVTPVVSSLANNPAASSTTTVKSTAAGPKRIQHPRQNHGRAVAPPQLPSDLGSGPANSLADRLDGDLHEEAPPSNETVLQLANDESGIDFSQSPIAQRLLKQYKDHKGTELITQF